ncbi:MAG: hypothetical protein KDD22_06235 [Bdellovibrionales bacterium]|nr:hypothetical protein [Bdellovibrionales bacterium]
MEIARDRLFEIFDRHLQEGKWQSSSQDEFIFRIVEEYVIELIRVGHIPIHYLEAIRQDLEDEVLEMFQVKTYGVPKKLSR